MIVVALQVHRVYLHRPLCGQLLVLFDRRVVEALDKAVLVETSPIDDVKEDLYGPFPAIPVLRLLLIGHLGFDG